MENGSDNLVLRLLRKIDTRMDMLGDGIREVKGRLGNLEEQTALLASAYASLSNRMDRFDERLARVERRLELREPVDA